MVQGGVWWRFLFRFLVIMLFIFKLWGFFQVFLGQKYGYRPIPTHIPAAEFELLRECAKNIQDELELLDAWYKKDMNTVPPVYVLQPISSILSNFNNKV